MHVARLKRVAQARLIVLAASDLHSRHADHQRTYSTRRIATRHAARLRRQHDRLPRRDPSHAQQRRRCAKNELAAFSLILGSPIALVSLIFQLGIASGASFISAVASTIFIGALIGSGAFIVLLAGSIALMLIGGAKKLDSYLDIGSRR